MRKIYFNRKHFEKQCQVFEIITMVTDAQYLEEKRRNR